jgi:hypothetical protein
MNIIVLLLLGIALWHFIYDGIVAPSIRFNLRNNLFALRDELRVIKIEGLDHNDEKAFWFVHNGVNNFINRLPLLTLIRVLNISSECDKNPKLQDVISKHEQTVKNVKNRRINDIFEETNHILKIAFIVNMGGWFIYIVPIVLLATFMKKLSKITIELVTSPTRDIDRFIPCS